MKEIKLTNGGISLVDDEDFEFFSHWRWSRSEAKGRVYAVKCFWVRGENRRVTYGMHHFLMVGHDGVQIDHIDGNGLNNQKHNLRSVTISQNQFNSKKRIDNTSGYRGVTTLRGKPMAQIQAGKKHIFLGVWATCEYAAFAFNCAAEILHGEHGRRNEVIISSGAADYIQSYVASRISARLQGIRLPNRKRLEVFCDSST